MTQNRIYVILNAKQKKIKFSKNRRKAMDLTRLNELADCYNKELDQQRENLTQEIREEARRILNQFDIQKIAMQTGAGVDEIKGIKNVLRFAAEIGRAHV